MFAVASLAVEAFEFWPLRHGTARNIGNVCTMQYLDVLRIF